MTVGRGPFGQQPAGRFDVDIPERIVYVERFPRRVRGIKDGEPVVDSDAVQLVHATGRLPYYAFPAADVHLDAARDEKAAPGHVRVPWDAVDAWFEEDEQVFVHVRDPYHRIDVVPTSRRVVVSLDGVALADSTSVVGLYETSLPVRWYFSRDDVRLDLLERSETVTQCAYKGQPVHWSAQLNGTLHEDVAWSYDDEVRREAEDVRGRIAFYDERVDVNVDGVRQARPVTAWSRPTEPRV